MWSRRASTRAISKSGERGVPLLKPFQKVREIFQLRKYIPRLAGKIFFSLSLRDPTQTYETIR
jgi:hypothetical protein